MQKNGWTCFQWLAIGVAIFGLGCAGSIGTPPAPKMSDAERMLGLGFMPEQTEGVLHIKISELWKAPLLQGIVDSPQARTISGDLQLNTGLTPADIESVSIGVTDVQAVKATLFGMAVGMSPVPPKGVIVIRTTKAMSLEKFLKSSDEIKPAIYNSKKYFEFARGDAAGWIAAPTTLVVAKIEDLQATMDRGETSRLRSELTFMDTAAQVIVIAAPKDPKNLTKGMFQSSTRETTPEIAAMQQTLTEALPAVGLGISVRGGVDVRTALLLESADSAGKVKSGLESVVAGGKQRFDDSRKTLLPELAELVDVLWNNIHVESQAKVVNVTTNLPDSTQRKIEDLAPLLLVEMGINVPARRVKLPADSATAPASNQ